MLPPVDVIDTAMATGADVAYAFVLFPGVAQNGQRLPRTAPGKASP